MIFKIFMIVKIFCECIKMKKNRIWKRFYRIERQWTEDREVKIKREIEELFFKPIIVPIDDMDKFEQK